jgi:hypothetical protein
MELRSITLLNDGGDVRLPARIDAREGRRLMLSLAGPIDRDTAIRIDIDDQVLLGEVTWCAKTKDGFTAEVELDQAITSVHDLTRLVNALVGEDKRTRMSEQRP